MIVGGFIIYTMLLVALLAYKKQDVEKIYVSRFHKGEPRRAFGKQVVALTKYNVDDKEEKATYELLSCGYSKNNKRLIWSYSFDGEECNKTIIKYIELYD